jgi:hypothetical protein
VSGAALSGRLPDGDADGLHHLLPDLVADPTQVRVMVALIDTSKVTTKVDDATVTATVRVRRVEALTDPVDCEAARRILQRAYERRTGLTVLPFELETDVISAFDTDTSTEDTDD